MPGVTRDEQNRALSRSVLKYAQDKALRLMLPEPRSGYETVGEKICQELAHFSFARSTTGRGYELTESGKTILALLNQRKNVELRRVMATVHLQTYTNLRVVVQSHIAQKAIFSPTVEVAHATERHYIASLLRPTLGDAADAEAEAVLERMRGCAAKKIEDALRQTVLEHAIQGIAISVALFRSMCDRLVSLRLLNTMRATVDSGECSKSYSPCVEIHPGRKWHNRLDVPLSSGTKYTIYLSEPNMQDEETQHDLVQELDSGFSVLQDQAGYYDLPDVRDFVCERLLIAEAAFDEGINVLLDQNWTF